MEAISGLLRWSVAKPLFHKQIYRCLSCDGVRLMATVPVDQAAKKAKKDMKELPREKYPVVVIGGGAAGLSVATQLRKLIGPNRVAVVEPRQNHFYQPLWTLVGGGKCDLETSRKPMGDIMPTDIIWIRDAVKEFLPEQNRIITMYDSEIDYHFMVVATGVELRFNWIKGMIQALEEDSSVRSNYSYQTVQKTFPAIQNIKSGNAIFTFPATPIKCAGAPQKIMYLADEILNKSGVRKDVDIIYCTSLPTIFSVPKYGAALSKIAQSKNIDLRYRQNLIEVDCKTKTAIFENLDTKEKMELPYDLLHVTPPMSPSPVLQPLADGAGYVSVDKHTLQHTKYKNVFALGDCSNLPTSKTAAAVAGQSGILVHNVVQLMNDEDSSTFQKYDGYSSCPLVTGFDKGILAEFDYNLEPKETFPFDQAKERRFFYWMKKDALPTLYWKYFLKGNWLGPSAMRERLKKWAKWIPEPN